VKPKYRNILVILSISILGLTIGLIVFTVNFNIFDEPVQNIIRTECDHMGIKQASVFTLTGNATLNPSIHVSTELGCNDYNEHKNSKIIFTADNGRIEGDEVDIKWTSFDTLTVVYNSNLRIFEQQTSMNFQDSTNKFVIQYKEK